MIVSVSRRCDIPRFQFDWFMTLLDKGFVETSNPYNANQVRRVSLLPDDVDAFIFWTRDPSRVLANADELRKCGFSFYVMVSLTGYPDALESNQIPALDAVKSIKDLSRKIGPDRVIWRYDPLILTSVTNDEFQRVNFAELARNLSGYVKRVIVSVYDEYKSAAKRLATLERDKKIKSLNMDEDILRGILHDFSKSASAAGMEIQSCAEKEDYSSIGVKPGACVDAALLNKLFNLKPGVKDKNQRPNCLCQKSVDIGVYGTCAAGCVYCYAW